MPPKHASPGTSARLARKGAARAVDAVASALIALGITLVMVSIGIKYVADDDEVQEAATVVAHTAGQGRVAAGYVSVKQQAQQLKAAAIGLVPEHWRTEARPFTVGFGVGALLVGAVVLGKRAESRAHATRDLGWAIAAPGVVAAFVLAILQWRATRAVEAALKGETRADDALAGARLAFEEGGLVLLPALLGGAAFVILGIAIARKRRNDRKAEPLAPGGVFARFCIVFGLVPVVHLLAMIAMAALSNGCSIDPAIEPIHRPVAYAGAAALFALGVALWGAGRSEIKRFA